MSRRSLVWVGPLYDQSGYGYVTRNYLRALLRSGFQIYCIPVAADHRSFLREEEIAELTQVHDWQPLSGKTVPVVFNVDGTMLTPLRQSVRDHLATLSIVPQREIAVSIFETHRIPETWVSAFNRLDEVWVPSQFNRETFTASGVSPEKIRVVPYAIDTEFFTPDQAPPPHNALRILYVFEFGFRKGVDLLLDSYCQAFSPTDPVELVLKTWSRAGVNVLQYMQSYLFYRFGVMGRTQYPTIQLMNGPIGQQELLQLYRSADLYISTDRANGWGMPVMESMACGVPSMAIDWSGGTEFLNANNGYPIPVDGSLEACDARLVEQNDIYRGQKWATVEPRTVVDVMRSAVNDPARGLKSVKARQTSLQYSLSAVGDIVKSILE